MDNEINKGYSLGKGEVDSSILSGSTIYAHEHGPFAVHVISHSAVSGSPKQEHDATSRGKSVDSVQDKFAIALRELIAMCMDGGMTTWEIAEAMDKEKPSLLRPYQNPEDDSAR
jgi:hypothetical protein